MPDPVKIQPVTPKPAADAKPAEVSDAQPEDATPPADVPAKKGRKAKAAEPVEPAGPRYRVVHHQVGKFPATDEDGNPTFVTAEDFPTGEAAIERLLGLGAIEEVDEDA